MVRSLGGVDTLAAMTAAVLAHQGGWDELLLVLVPIAVVAWLLWLAKRRVSRTVVTEPTTEPTSEQATDPADDRTEP